MENPDLPAPEERQRHLPALPVGALPRYQSTPPPVDFALATAGKFDLIYKPEGTAGRKASLEERFQALLSPHGLTSPQRWEDVLAGASRRARVFLIDRSGERWEVVDLEIDHGGETGQLRLRHLGSRSRGGDMVVDLRQLLGHAVPVMVYKNPGSSDERQRRAEREGRLEDAYRERVRRGEAEVAREWLTHTLMLNNCRDFLHHWGVNGALDFSPTLVAHSLPVELGAIQAKEWLEATQCPAALLCEWIFDQVQLASPADLFAYQEEGLRFMGHGDEDLQLWASTITNPGPDERRRRAARESAAGVPGAQARLEAELRRQPLRQPKPITLAALIGVLRDRGWGDEEIAEGLDYAWGAEEAADRLLPPGPGNRQNWTLYCTEFDRPGCLAIIDDFGLQGEWKHPDPDDFHATSQFRIDAQATLVSQKNALTWLRYALQYMEERFDPPSHFRVQAEEWLNRHFSRCGLNADWCVQAWHLGPSPEPNRTDGDYYVIDNEDDGSFSLVRRYYSEEDNDDVQEITSGTARHCVATWRQLTDPAYQAWGAELRKRSRRR